MFDYGRVMHLRLAATLLPLVKSSRGMEVRFDFEQGSLSYPAVVTTEGRVKLDWTEREFGLLVLRPSKRVEMGVDRRPAVSMVTRSGEASCGSRASDKHSSQEQHQFSGTRPTGEGWN